ncbi:MAG: type III secretion system chaperone [Chlamydiales bacterium]
MLKQLIDQLSLDLEEPLNANHDGSYSLYFEPDLELSVRENIDLTISFFTVLSLLPEAKTEAFLLKMMVGNLFGRETGGSILGLTKDGKKITFLRFLPKDLDYKDFHDYLEDFLNYAEAWKIEATEFIKS